MSRRVNVPQTVADELMYRNRHVCCLCHAARKHVQIHHIDGNPANFNYDNLAVLSLDCHSLVTGNEGFGRKYAPGEVSKYKAEWEAHCAVLNGQDEISEQDDDEVDEGEGDEQPASHHYEESIIEADSHMQISYTLDEKDGLAFWIESDEPLTIMIMEAADYDLWINDKEIEFYAIHEDVYKLNTTFDVPHEDEYSMVLCNLGSEAANVQLDIAVWE